MQTIATEVMTWYNGWRRRHWSSLHARLMGWL